MAMNEFRRRKKSVYTSVEQRLAKLHPSVYLSWLPIIFRFFHPRAIINKRVNIAKDEDGSWYVEDEFGRFYIPSHRRFARYFCCGVRERFMSVLDRYIPAVHRESMFKDGVVVDVGANIGEFTVAALMMGAKHVVCFEPDPHAARCLRKNVARFGGRATVCEILLDEKVGQRTFYLAPETADSSFIPPAQDRPSIVLAAARLDSILREMQIDSVSVVKVEAEGAEPEVLSGASELLSLQGPLVLADTSCERQGKSTYSECEAILRSYGYRIEKHREGMQLIGFKVAK